MHAKEKQTSLWSCRHTCKIVDLSCCFCLQLSSGLGSIDAYNKGRSGSVSSSISSDFGSGHSYHKAPGSEREDSNVSWSWCSGHNYSVARELQALVYDILPSTTAVFSCAIGSRKLSANDQFFCLCSNSSKFVTNNSDYITRLFYNWPCCLCQLK